MANFSPRVSGFTFKLSGFSGFEICRGLRVWPFFVLGFLVQYYSNFLFCRVPEVIECLNKAQGVNENENAGNNRRVLTKNEDFCSIVQSRVLGFYACGISGFANFGPGWRVLVPPKVLVFWKYIIRL